MESFQLTRIVAASPVAVQIVQYMRLSTEPVELLLEVYVGWYYSNQGLLILSTNIDSRQQSVQFETFTTWFLRGHRALSHRAALTNAVVPPGLRPSIRTVDVLSLSE